MTTTPPTLGDTAKRLYEKFAETQELLEPKKDRLQATHWDDLPEWRQEVWVTVAVEAVKVGAEIQKEIDPDDGEPRCVGHVSAVGRRTNRCFLLPNHTGECL